MTLAMTREDLMAFLKEAFPQVSDDYVVDHVEEKLIRVRLVVDDRHLRPGGTISGPSMFSLADVTVYLGVLAMIGPKALAVTTNCSIDFMRKPAAGQDLVAEARLLKLGRVLAVGDVVIWSDTGPEAAEAGRLSPVARATLTYSIPPER
ncbi:PaaI family thioesterase [Pseudooceanicola marinus]|uniref:PaaI family thioesterase n=1 Tax=Pseudooceanicola marinus TaxID=396013 RepID=UPI001CD260CB|nr:PaaI family thioesterase [Pseudooceanicola marinus]MCA1334288.1 PaaI family thioesterase [Pseudooceanicola marinus]